MTRFDCCKTKTADGPFIKDFGSNTSVWSQLIVSSLAFISSAILVMGLSLSMLRVKKLRRGEGLPAGGGTRRRRHQDSSERSSQRAYNGYNFYLILLAIPDLPNA
jgi:hypothetical protein